MASLSHPLRINPNVHSLSFGALYMFYSSRVVLVNFNILSTDYCKCWYVGTAWFLHTNKSREFIGGSSSLLEIVKRCLNSAFFGFTHVNLSLCQNLDISFHIFIDTTCQNLEISVHIFIDTTIEYRHVFIF